MLKIYINKEQAKLKKENYQFAELAFLELFKNVLLSDVHTASLFRQYVLQFHPKYEWIDYDNTDITSIMLELAVRELQITNENQTDEETFTQALKFGTMVTDFLIRFAYYNLIDDNVLITSENLYKRMFKTEITEDYKVLRPAKLVLDVNNSGKKVLKKIYYSQTNDDKSNMFSYLDEYKEKLKN